MSAQQRAASSVSFLSFDPAPGCPVEVLASRRESIRRQAGASLNQIGLPALPALTLALVKSRRLAVQQAAAETLWAIAPRLPQEQFLDPLQDAMTAAPFSAAPSVRMALANLIAAQRKAVELQP